MKLYSVLSEPDWEHAADVLEIDKNGIDIHSFGKKARGSQGV